MALEVGELTEPCHRAPAFAREEVLSAFRNASGPQRERDKTEFYQCGLGLARRASKSLLQPENCTSVLGIRPKQRGNRVSGREWGRQQDFRKGVGKRQTF